MSKQPKDREIKEKVSGSSTVQTSSFPLHNLYHRGGSANWAVREWVEGGLGVEDGLLWRFRWLWGMIVSIDLMSSLRISTFFKPKDQNRFDKSQTKGQGGEKGRKAGEGARLKIQIWNFLRKNIRNIPTNMRENCSQNRLLYSLINGCWKDQYFLLTIRLSSIR